MRDSEKSALNQIHVSRFTFHASRFTHHEHDQIWHLRLARAHRPRFHFRQRAFGYSSDLAIPDHAPHSTLNASRTVIMGYDTRFLGREFSLAAAEVLAANGLTPLYLRFDGKRTGRLERQG